MPPWERPESMGAGFVGAHVRSTHATAGIATANSALSRVGRAIGAIKSGARGLLFVTSLGSLRCRERTYFSDFWWPGCSTAEDAQ